MSQEKGTKKRLNKEARFACLITLTGIENRMAFLLFWA